MDTETTATRRTSRTLDDTGSAAGALEALDQMGACSRWSRSSSAISSSAAAAAARPSTSTQEVTRGDLTVTVTATGNLEPRNQVDIGSELSGTIRSVNVDVNDDGEGGPGARRARHHAPESAGAAGAELARIGRGARAAERGRRSKEARANFARLQKVRELSGNKLPSQQDHGCRRSGGRARRRRGAAARAAVAQARANLDAVQTDLGKTDIRSPINGVVLVRSVEPGQTVAASLQAPVLFTLAEDLKKMELHVSVDEADVGSVEVGQKATFTVDAFPNRQFSRAHHAGALRVEQHAEEREQRLQSEQRRQQRDLDRRRDVRNRARSRQLGPAAAAGHDRDGGDRHHEHRGCGPGAERSAALHAGRRRRRPVRRTRKHQRGAAVGAHAADAAALASAASNAAARRMGRVVGARRRQAGAGRCSGRARPTAA